MLRSGLGRGLWIGFRVLGIRTYADGIVLSWVAAARGLHKKWVLGFRDWGLG